MAKLILEFDDLMKPGEGKVTAIARLQHLAKHMILQAVNPRAVWLPKDGVQGHIKEEGPGRPRKVV